MSYRLSVGIVNVLEKKNDHTILKVHCQQLMSLGQSLKMSLVMLWLRSYLALCVGCSVWDDIYKDGRISGKMLAEIVLKQVVWGCKMMYSVIHVGISVDPANVGMLFIHRWELVCQEQVFDGRSGGHFKIRLLNLRALKFSPVNKVDIFHCMAKIFCVEFQRYPLKFHTKFFTHTLKDAIFMQCCNSKNS